MNNLSFSKKDDLLKFLKEEKFNKTLIICGEKSFKGSGANKLFENLLKNLVLFIAYKNSEYYFP